MCYLPMVINTAIKVTHDFAVASTNISFENPSKHQKHSTQYKTQTDEATKIISNTFKHQTFSVFKLWVAGLC